MKRCLARLQSVCHPVGGSKDPTMTRWSMRALMGQMGGQSLKKNADKVLRDVALRLDKQHASCEALMDHVTHAMDPGANPANKTNGQQQQSNADVSRPGASASIRAVRAVNQPVNVPFRLQLKQHQEQLKIGKNSIRQLGNLCALHSDTLQLTKGLLEIRNVLQRFSKADQHLVQATLEQVRSRHASTVETLADLAIDLRAILLPEKEQVLDEKIDAFLRGRLGIQLLCDHYIALHKGKADGSISVDCKLQDVLQDAVTEATNICDANLNTAPEVIMNNEEGARVTLIRPWIHHALVEVLKNGMASAVEKSLEEGESCQPPPPIYIRVRQDDKHIYVDVIDQGVGLKDLTNAFAFAKSSSLKRWDRLDEQQSYAMVRSPLQSLGVGLPLSRMMMQHFGGDVKLKNRPVSKDGLDTGCTTTLVFSLDDAFEEKLQTDEPIIE